MTPESLYKFISIMGTKVVGESTGSLWHHVYFLCDQLSVVYIGMSSSPYRLYGHKKKKWDEAYYLDYSTWEKAASVEREMIRACETRYNMCHVATAAHGIKYIAIIGSTMSACKNHAKKKYNKAAAKRLLFVTKASDIVGKHFSEWDCTYCVNHNPELPKIIEEIERIRSK